MRCGRIGSVDTNIRHSGSESYDQGFVSIAKPQTTQGLLLLKHALRRTCADSASLDAMESASRHKANQIYKKKIRTCSGTSPAHCSARHPGQQIELGSSGSPQEGLLTVGPVCRRQSMHVFAFPAGALLYDTGMRQKDQKIERALGLNQFSHRSGST